MVLTSELNAMTAPLLQMQGITKSFPGVRALQGVDLALAQGEVLALLGENGAGKSTLIKILGGYHSPDSGTIHINGHSQTLSSPLAAQRAGVGVIYQEFNLVPALSARENIFLGQERSRISFVRKKDEQTRASELFRRIGVPVDSERWCRDLSVAQQQIVEIAKALALNAKILVMDEPSAALSPREVTGLMGIVRELRSQGIGLIYISHRLDEIFSIADRVMVLRDGQHVGTRDIGSVTRSELIEMMVGRKLEDEFPRRTIVPSGGHVSGRSLESNEPTAAGLSVRDLRRGTSVRGVSFDVHRGELVALTGLVGAGRTETARLIFGADRAEGGELWLDGKRLRVRSPRQAIAAGVCLLTEDRKSQGLVLGQSVLENFGLPNLKRFAPQGWIRQRQERASFLDYVKQLQIKVTGPTQKTATLSGGNQQKVVLAKWLERNADVIIFDEPTRGIDVGAKYEIYVLMNQLVQQGKAVLMISSELPEVLGMADRILVMHNGLMTGEITDVSNATQEQIMELAVKMVDAE
jgi:ABC-type sugar transport system ATPase subunit